MTELEEIDKIIQQNLKGAGRASRGPTQGFINGYSGHGYKAYDVAANEGTPIYGSGTITKAGWDGKYGNSVEIRNPQGNIQKFSHLSKYDVTPGQTINGQLGRVGNTGNSFGAHLDVEFRDAQGRLISPFQNAINGIMNATQAVGQKLQQYLPQQTQPTQRPSPAPKQNIQDIFKKAVSQYGNGVRAVSNSPQAILAKIKATGRGKLVRVG